ncbi:MAG: rhombosortase [Desulfobacterales bacterium]|nr:rhombosortase [Desulfobacterales bacterium]
MIRIIKNKVKIDLLFLIVLIISANLHLIGFSFSLSLIFDFDAVLKGEIWRLFTFPFVHVSFYHFILDVSAFFIFYLYLFENTSKKFLYILSSSCFSLLAALAASPDVYYIGLCGLSGIDHGLMAVVGLKLMENKESKKEGLIIYLLVLIKSCYETFLGNMVFDFVHINFLGTPIGACHAGGVLGGTIAYALTKK